MEKEKLSIIETLTEGVQVGCKNLPSLIVATLLYVLTIWIPYLNVGTTIAMLTIPGRLAKGEVISPTFIFDSEYRKDFAGFFLLVGLLFLVEMVGFMFLYIPGIVIALAMSLSYYILVDDGVSAPEAMRLSNEATYGNKLRIFSIELCFIFVVYVILGIIVLITAALNKLAFCVFFVIISIPFIVAFEQGIKSVIYRRLYLEPKGTEIEVD